MKGKTKASLLGVVIGASMVILFEFLDARADGGGFFDSVWSWVILVVAVVIFPFIMRRAYDKKEGIYALRKKSS